MGAQKRNTGDPEKTKPVMVKASDCNCSWTKCKAKAVCFWPIIDPDIKSYPYCREHVDKLKIELMLKLNELPPWQPSKSTAPKRKKN
jgi:hypothetical protein